MKNYENKIYIITVIRYFGERRIKMKSIYFEVYNGYYLTDISLKKGKIQYSLNEDDRLWFSEEDATNIENILRLSNNLPYARCVDKEFPKLLNNLKAKGVIDDAYISSCYRCYCD